MITKYVDNCQKKVVIDVQKSEKRPPKPRAKAAPARKKGAAHAAKIRPAKAPRVKKPVNRANRRVLSTLWLLPVGLPLMWRRACTWPRAVKAGITVAAVALVAALLAFPLPSANRNVAGGVHLVNSTDEVEVYGPDLPTYIVPGYTSEQSESIIVDTVNNTKHYVYAADGAKCYHEYECKFAFASSQRLTVYEAYFLGFKPCPRCNPPKFNGVP